MRHVDWSDGPFAFKDTTASSCVHHSADPVIQVDYQCNSSLPAGLRQRTVRIGPPSLRVRPSSLPSGRSHPRGTVSSRCTGLEAWHWMLQRKGIAQMAMAHYLFARTCGSAWLERIQDVPAHACHHIHRSWPSNQSDELVPLGRRAIIAWNITRSRCFAAGICWPICHAMQLETRAQGLPAPIGVRLGGAGIVLISSGCSAS